jgi:hypothetical protein
VIARKGLRTKRDKMKAGVPGFPLAFSQLLGQSEESGLWSQGFLAKAVSENLLSLL